MTLSGVGGAFGGREDLSMQIHACLLALRTGKPVKIVYNRFESFFGHVHRHPAKLYYEHGATRDGKLTHMKCRIVLDGGAYASASPAVVGNAASLARRPVRRRRRRHRGASRSTPTTRPAAPCAASARSRRASPTRRRWTSSPAKLGMDPVEFRQLNAMEQGTLMPTGQPVDSPAPVAELLRRVKAMPLPPERQWLAAGEERGRTRSCPAACPTPPTARASSAASATRSASRTSASPRASTTTPPPGCGMEVVGGEPVATVHTAMAEVGQGGVTVHAQIARTELGVTQVTIHPADTQVGSAGSTSASRQTYVTGGAVKNTCELVREKVLEIGRRKFGSYHPAWATAELLLEGGKVVTDGGEVLADLVDVLGGRGRRHRGGVAAPAHRGLRPAHRPGRRPRPVLLRRAPRGRRGGHRTRPGQGHRTGLRPGRRQGAQPAVRRRPDPGRHHPGPGRGGHGGDRRRPEDREGAQPLLHGLSDPHHPRHADHPGRRARTRRRPRPVRAARRRRGPDPVVDPGRPRGDPERDGSGAEQDAGPAGAPDRQPRNDPAAAGAKETDRCWTSPTS